MNKRRWLEKFTWDVVTEMNRRACQAAQIPHGISSEGSDQARTIWEQTVAQEQHFRDVVEICRLCHRLVPFTAYNGSVFTGIARSLSDQLCSSLNDTRAFMFKSAVGHYVAGVIGSQPLDDIFRRVLPEK